MDKTTSTILITVAVVLCLAIGGLALLGADYDDDRTTTNGNTHDGEIKWDYKFIEDVTSFPIVTMQGITATAAAGNHFIVLKVIEKNVSYDGGDYKPSLTHFKLVGSDDITYDYSSRTYSYSEDNNELYNITLGKNTSKTYHIVFEVPSTTSLSKVIYASSGYAKYVAEQDESLLS